MSKASEFAASRKAGETFTHTIQRQKQIVRVTEQGQCGLSEALLTPKEAIVTAHWILDTFGEPNPNAP